MKSNKSRLVLTILWLVLAAVCWIIGLVAFLQGEEIGEKIGMWFVWGALCCIPLFPSLIYALKKTGREGAAQGANDYTATVTSNTVTVRNHPIRGAIIGFVGGLIGCLLAGPVVIFLHVFRKVKDLIAYIRAVRSESAQKSQQN